MSEVKDPAIKLFGKTIPLPPNEEASSVLTTTTSLIVSADSDDHEQQQKHCSSSPIGKFCSRVGDGQEDNKKKTLESELTETRQEDPTSGPTAEQLKDPAASCEDPKTPSVDKEPLSPKVSKNDEQSETSISQEKTLKKPDTILPCPRCSSMETKFCYYNNYNVSQPRHFCKNCQRYWTAGGTMRNVPVGSGRRKNKSSSASYYRHIMVSEALQAAQADATNEIHHPTLRTNDAVLTFGSDAPLCEPLASAAGKLQNCDQNGFHVPEHKIYVSCEEKENGDEHSNRSSITGSDSADKGGNSGLQEPVMENSQTLPLQVPSFQGPLWPYPWNSPQWRSAMPPPAFDPSGFPIAFYPAPPYWGCTLPGPWNVSWLPPPPASPGPSMYYTPNSPTLGKHSRNGDLIKTSNSQEEEPLKENNSERCIWIPKTLRIDDPSEAAKSSIWSTLGINNERSNSINGGGLFKAFQSKGDAKNHRTKTSLVLHANPAALSRSLNFHESAY